MMQEINIDKLSDGEQELYILAEELAKINLFVIYFNDFSFIGTYRTREQVIEAIVNNEKDKSAWARGLWPNVQSVPKSEIQETLDEFGKIYCPELRAEYTNICELLKDLKIFSIASLIE